MTRRWSVRSRVMLGGALWAIGFFALSTVVVTLKPRLMPTVSVIHRHAHAAVVVTVVCVIGGFALIRAAIAQLNAIRPRLADVRRGVEQRLHGSYPSEVQPLVDDLNALLDHRDETVRRAIAAAGDLAHGLKTPLAILAQETDRAEIAGNLELATTIGDQIDRMRRHIDHHLARARAAASGAASGARCPVADAAAGLARTLDRLYGGRGITVDVQVPPDHVVRGQREDVDEMLGNLLDNACKWTRSRVVISSSVDGAMVVVDVDDDGRGLPVESRDRVLQRGVKADEAASGSGLGLAIVADLAEVYGGSISLQASPLGGLRARLRLPSAR